MRRALMLRAKKSALARRLLIVAHPSPQGSDHQPEQVTSKRRAEQDWLRPLFDDYSATECI